MTLDDFLSVTRGASSDHRLYVRAAGGIVVELTGVKGETGSDGYQRLIFSPELPLYPAKVYDPPEG